MFKRQVESNWLSTNKIELTGGQPEGRRVTGLQHIISVRINNVRKEMMTKLSSRHNFKIIKSVSKEKREETGKKRRKKLRFQREFIVFDNSKNNAVDGTGPDLFDLYLKSIHKEHYQPFEIDDIVEEYPTFEDICGTASSTTKKQQTINDESDSSRSSKKKTSNRNIGKKKPSISSVSGSEESSAKVILNAAAENIEAKRKLKLEEKQLEVQKKIHQDKLEELKKQMKEHEEQMAQLQNYNKVKNQFKKWQNETNVSKEKAQLLYFTFYFSKQ